MLTRRAFMASVAAAVLAATGASLAAAQSYPTRLIKLVVPSPAGGPHEVVVRVLAERMASLLGQPVIVENLPGGAAGTVGTKAVTGAAPDGHTLLFSAPNALVVAPAIYKNLGYDPARDLAPVATIFSSPQMLVVNPALPVASLAQLVAYAKAHPGKINFASPGYGTQPHLLGEMLKQMASVDMLHVPYRGAAAPIADLLAGQVQLMFETIPLLVAHIDAGKLRPLAVADHARSPRLPAVPTTVESGFPRLQATLWVGVLAPAGTPAVVVSRLNATINEILRSPDLHASLAKLSAVPKIGSPQDFAAFMAAERQKWTEVVKAANISVD
jgi:tripartite-type tricarboxylate transporter receptor subunit TctC